jgi:mevalonate kinase
LRTPTKDSPVENVLWELREIIFEGMALTEITVSTPGKLILMGEHAVVHGHPALVSSVDLRLRVVIAARPGGGVGVQIRLPELGYRGATDWPEIVGYTERARESWNRGAPSDSSGAEADHLVRIALGEACRFLGESGGPPLGIRVESEIPVGCGFGSSAALAVGVVSAYLMWRGHEWSEQDLQEVSLEVERRQHGAPSGVDNAAVLQGGVLWAMREEAELNLTALTIQSPFVRNLRVYDTGAPVESTGRMVAAVRERMEREPRRVAGIFDRMEERTRSLRDRIARSDERPEETLALFREYEACLEELGVVPAAVRELVREIERHGGAAKISGAGALTGSGAGSLIIYHPEPERLAEWKCLRAVRSLGVRFGVEGVRQEVAA